MNEIYLTGNNDGDYIRIRQSERQKKGNLMELEVGHCCVVIAKHLVPVEFLSNLIYMSAMKNNIDMNMMVKDAFDGYFGTDYFNERTQKVKRLKW